MTFDTHQTKPWPLHRRINIGIGLVFNLPGTRSIRKWLFDPCFLFTKPGDQLEWGKNFPVDQGPFFVLEDQDPYAPLRAAFYNVQGALRIVGFDLGFQLFYRLKGAHKK